MKLFLVLLKHEFRIKNCQKIFLHVCQSWQKTKMKNIPKYVEYQCNTRLTSIKSQNSKEDCAKLQDVKNKQFNRWFNVANARILSTTKNICLETIDPMQQIYKLDEWWEPGQLEE